MVVPTSVVTRTGPETASVSTTAWMTVSVIEPSSAEPVPKLTFTVLARWLPWISTSWPERPESGEKDVISGNSPTKKSRVLVPVPFAVVTVIGPVTAPGGTVVWMTPNVADCTLATAPPMRTSVGEVNRPPLIVTASPILPPSGEKPRTTGRPLSAACSSAHTCEW